MQIVKENWGTVEGQSVYLITLKNAAGSVVKLTNYGARIVAIKVPDQHGKLDDVVLGFNTLSPYLEDKHFIGATIGRFANRISNAQFMLENHVWHLEANEGPHCNHSGRAGFDHQVFEVSDVIEVITEDGPVAKLEFFLSDEHNNGGFPGNLNLKVSYSWNEKIDRLNIHYEAYTDQKSILNLTNHSYFNLSGAEKSNDVHTNCLMHRLEIKSSSILEMDKNHLPTGRRIGVDHEQVSGKIYDLCKAMEVDNRSIIPINLDRTSACDAFFKRTNNTNGDLDEFKGMNSCFELRLDELPVACSLTCDRSGRELEVKTSYPGLLIYTGDKLGSRDVGYFGRPYRSFDGVALECQYYPDSPNRPEFPPTIIEPNRPYCEYITYNFYIKGRSINH